MNRSISKPRTHHTIKRFQLLLHPHFHTAWTFTFYRSVRLKSGLILALLFCLTACYGPIEELFGEVEDKVSKINLDHYITWDNTDIAFKSIDGNDVYIRSNRSTITISSGSVLGDVLVEGSNCLITFEDPISIQRLDITGSDNVINVPASSGITINSDSGSGNTLIMY